MISLISLKPELEKKLPLFIVRAKIECFQKGSVSDAIIKKLALMGFDSDYTFPHDLKGKDIVFSLLEMNSTIYFSSYVQNYFAWKLFPVNAHVLNSKPNLINFNTRQFTNNYDQEEREITVWHEIIHIIDHYDKERLFWHDKNDLKGKDETAPVKLAKFLASIKLIKEGDSWKLI